MLQHKKRNRGGLILLLLLHFGTNVLIAKANPAFSTAGFYELKDAGRKAYNFNMGWRFFKGDIKGAQLAGFDDTNWELLSLPNGLEYLPFEASGSINYQGPAWYRKHITFNKEQAGKKRFLYFEAIMGKSKIYVDGQLVKTHFGGFLPIVVDITEHITPGTQSVIAVWADNSDDPSYPPGKAQTVMDFAYFGGIYRDCWLVSTNPIHVTDPNFVDKQAGGGIFVHYQDFSKDKVRVVIKTDVLNENHKAHAITLLTQLIDPDGKPVGKASSSIQLKAGKSITTTQDMVVQQPKLWAPDTPFLHDLQVKLMDENGKVIDGFTKKIGIRKIEFVPKKGFYLNGEKFEGKLMGGNRHQDFAYLGNALPNNTQYRDAKKLRDAGMRIIRSAHYPQDPAFMDACDALGLFVIVATPGWQFWPTKEVTLFENRVYSDIRQMVRQYRNRPSVILWEPILNETHYPPHFAKNTHDIVHAEYPYPGAFTACDMKAQGSEYFDVMYAGIGDTLKTDKCIYTREWGDNVDDWSSHNSPSRAAREWGEKAQLVQALHYSYPLWYTYYNYDRLYRSSQQFVGGTLWHSFDHQRGYHPDPFYGGLLDAIRQPKYAYYFFTSQRPTDVTLQNADSGPMVYIAHEMSPFSEPDVLVFSNCEQVRLIFCEQDTFLMQADHENYKMPHPYFYFKNVYQFMKVKALHRNKQFDQASLVAEGLIDGKVVATHKKYPAKRVSKIVLHTDGEGMDLIADGNDVLPIIASVCDADGNIKRLNNRFIRFEIEGEGSLIGDGMTGVNPVKAEWGTAPILVKASHKPGKITIKAHLVYEGKNQPLGAELVLMSKPYATASLYDELPEVHNTHKAAASTTSAADYEQRIKVLEQQIINKGLQEVEQQQGDFDTGKD